MLLPKFNYLPLLFSPNLSREEFETLAPAQDTPTEKDKQNNSGRNLTEKVLAFANAKVVNVYDVSAILDVLGHGKTEETSQRGGR